MLKPRFMHYRQPDDHPFTFSFSPQDADNWNHSTVRVKAVTVCHLEDEDGEIVAEGMAFCSLKDQFSRKKGRLISEGRARKALKMKGGG